MKHYILSILLITGVFTSIHSQNPNKAVAYKDAPSPSTYKNCEGFVLEPGFSYKATAGKVMSFKADPSVCVAESQDIKASSGQNYIMTVTPLDETAVADFSSGKLTLDYGARANVTIQYFDGLGRPMQTVQRKAAPDGNSDLVTIQEYDPFGRESNLWLPGQTKGNGAYTDYNTVTASAKAIHANDSKPYSYPVYEASPLNRVVEQYGPGEAWHTAKKAITTNYRTNVATGDSKLICSLYSVTGSGNSTQLKKAGNYAAGELYVTEIKDEELNTSYEFKDKLGQVVLTRQMDGSTSHDTYYVYDDFGSLSYVLPPLATDGLTANTTWKDTDNPIKQYAYLYKYNERRLCVKKQLPGCESISYVYDKSDRLIFSQDGEQAKNKKWFYTIPDVFGRVVLNGLCGNTDITDANFKNKLVIAEALESNTANKGYVIKVDGKETTLISSLLQTVNYYDNYRFINKYGFPNWTSTNKADFGKEYTSSAKGLLTGTAVAQLDKADTYQYVVMRYDYRGNIVETKSTNHLGGTESEYLAYHFSGQPKKKQHIHTVTIDNKTTQQQEDYAYSYDHTGRLKKTTHKLNNGPEVILAENTYDELGRLKTTKANNQANLNTSYAYTVRSWIETIKNYHFVETLDYMSNGNIKTQQWEQDNKKREYAFGYDQLSRLKTATYTALTSGDDSKYGTTYTYDKHGNPLTLTRYGITQAGVKNQIIDDLTFNYEATGNQVKYITDKGPNVKLTTVPDFKDYIKATTAEYVYNRNGAMTKDLNKGITDIRYNLLNLPEEMLISNESTRGKNYYSYNAAGVKMQVIHLSDPTLKIQPINGTGADAQYTVSATTDYVGNKIYENGVINKILIDNGYIENGNYYFYVKDHLGNNRVVTNAAAAAQQSNQYYPFGMSYGEEDEVKQGKQNFKYNGKELDRLHGLNQYDYSARYMDPATIRFTTVDPHAENYYSWSPYAYVANNPMRIIDPNGKDWFVNNENGNLFFLKGVSELRDEHREQYNLGNVSQYEHLGADDMFGDKIMQKGSNILNRKSIFIKADGRAQNFMGFFGYEIAERVTIKETETVLGGRMGTEDIEQTHYTSEQIGKAKITYMRPEKMDQKQISFNKRNKYTFSRTHEVTYETTKPAGIRPEPYFTGQKYGNQVNTTSVFLKATIDIIIGIFGK